YEIPLVTGVQTCALPIYGLKKRGYCYQWSEDLLIALDALKLTSLELRWGESNPGNWRENNCIVVTAKGRPFRSGIMLDCWRHLEIGRASCRERGEEWMGG